jgi:hypothetical protein
MEFGNEKQVIREESGHPELVEGSDTWCPREKAEKILGTVE